MKHFRSGKIEPNGISFGAGGVTCWLMNANVMKNKRTELKRKYTRVTKIGDKWNTYLQIDHQVFCVLPEGTKREAQWWADMLAIALERLLENETKRN